MKDQNDSFKALYEARHEPENLRPLAELYWRVLLLSAIMCAGAVIAFGIWEFSSVLRTISSAATQGTSQQAPAIDKAMLENALLKFSERQANFEMGKTAAPAVTDPSK